MHRRLTALIAVVIFIFVSCSSVFAGSMVTLYSYDGRSIMVDSNVVWDYMKVGWYKDIDDVRTTLYAPDGRSMKVWKSEVNTYLNLGWFKNIEDVKTTLYASDGRIMEVWNSEVNTYLNLGWFKNIEDVKTTLYAPDGRSIVVWNNEVEKYVNAGWFENIDDVRETLYAPDGRIMDVWKSEVERYKKLGWSSCVTMYAKDRDPINVPEYEVDMYKKLGWYTRDEFVFLLASEEYESYTEAGDYISALNSIAQWRELLWETDYEYLATKMMNTAMDTIREQTGSPAAVEWYYADNGNLEVSIRNVAYKDIIAFEYTFDSYDIFGNLIEAAQQTKYYCDDAFIMPGEAQTFSWRGRNNSVRWLKNFEFITVVYSDGTIWRK